MMTSYLGSLDYKSWKMTKIMPNSLKLLNHYILSRLLPKKILKGPSELKAENLGAQHVK